MSREPRPLCLVALMMLVGAAKADRIADRQADYSEEVAHCIYRGCSISIDTFLIDPAGSTCRVSKGVAVRVTIKYAYADGLKAAASIEGNSYCDAKPANFNLPSWRLESTAGDRPAWALNQANPETSDPVIASSILAAEESGMALHALRADGVAFAFDLSAIPSPMRYWTGAHGNHEHCVAALAKGK